MQNRSCQSGVNAIEGVEILGSGIPLFPVEILMKLHPLKLEVRPYLNRLFLGARVQEGWDLWCATEVAPRMSAREATVVSDHCVYCLAVNQSLFVLLQG